MEKNKRKKAIKFHQDLYDKKYKKRRKTCKGGKEHDWLLTLPDYIKITKPITPEMIIGYYKLEKEEREINIKSIEKFEKLGIRKFSGWNPTMKYYICSRCGKRDYK